MANEPASTSTPTAAPAGWYPDPETPGQQRYWDGSQWTDIHPPGSAGFQPQVQVGQSSSKATWALVTGILGIIILPVVFSILAIVFGVQAQSEVERNPGMEGKGRATAGIVLGIIGLIAWAIILITLMNR
jgi:hypothetical protein